MVWQSMRQWVRQGMGNWSGWAMPWAAMLHARMGNAEAPEMILRIWRRVFTNEGHGTLHDVGVRGFSALGDLHRTRPLPEKMQLDAGLAVVAALYEMLLYHQRGVHYIFAGVPAHWTDVSFAGNRSERSSRRRDDLLRQIPPQKTLSPAPQNRVPNMAQRHSRWYPKNFLTFWAGLGFC